jgi:hypothetical protein
LLTQPGFQDGLHLAIDFAAATTFIAAAASWLRGAKFVHSARSVSDDVGSGLLEVGELASAEVGAGVMTEE